MTDVFFKTASYDYNIIKPIIFEMMDNILKDTIQKNHKVLIKPNFLVPAEPKRAVLTHPLIVKAAVEYVLDKGCKPIIGDSPAVGTIDRIF
ncbi:MAG: DUF362 domain-containing protein, partial [Desulfobacterales bacterium]|nr:DUF362 domain-containing protein [Desulfobacterales bacterium]